MALAQAQNMEGQNGTGELQLDWQYDEATFGAMDTQVRFDAEAVV